MIQENFVPSSWSSSGHSQSVSSSTGVTGGGMNTSRTTVAHTTSIPATDNRRGGRVYRLNDVTTQGQVTQGSD
ncbi:hypothetical protein E2C01_086483 [Portunus trituberculatus]|uniref:Uncharacterized protein n=1 Tax=Portunus trituberculatus TaxID=210409 RepID=A0A5B7J9T7_PORTR|nr:hypothetical protein [Portunus trituberculatus]